MSDTNEMIQGGSWWWKLAKKMLFSPINTAFILAILYFAAQVYLFEDSITNRLILFALIGGWLLLFLLKHMVLLLVVLILVAGGGFFYYQQTQQEIRKCEEAGGYWNKKTKTCEKTVPLLEQAKRFIKKALIETQKAKFKEEK